MLGVGVRDGRVTCAHGATLGSWVEEARSQLSSANVCLILPVVRQIALICK